MPEMSDALLPNNDPDLELARAIGRGAGIDRANDPFADMLLAFRDDVAGERAGFDPQPETSARIWQAIALHTTRPMAIERPPHPRARSTRFPRMALAGSLVAVAVLAWLLVIQRSAPQALLASADAIPVTYSTDDGSIVTLRPHSSLYLLHHSDTEQLYRLDGDAYFDEMHNDARSFVVKADDAEIAVLGTQFVVKNWGEATEVYLQEGSVALRHAPSGNAVVLTPGDLGRVNSRGASIDSDGGNAAEALDWIENELFFERQPLHRIVDELNFHFGITIDYPSERLGDTISGTIILDDAPGALDQLALITDGRFVQRAAHRYQFEPR